MNNTWYSFSVSDIGKKRSVNQDSIFVDDKQKIWVVADGMGGHRDGDKASQAVVNTFNKMLFSQVMSERMLQIEKCIRTLNVEFQNYSTNQLNGQLMGTTLVIFTVCQGIGAVIWAGDSRCYKITNNNISQISWDHSYVDELLRSGHIAEEEAATSKLSNVITRAVGAHEELFFDHVILPYSDKDTFLLCSDGLTNELTDKTINSIVSLQGCSQESITNLLNKTLAHGAKDNVSIILISSKLRRPHNSQESTLIKTYSNQLNVLAKSLFNKEIDLTTYYLQMPKIINQSISSHHRFKGQDTQELPVLKQKPQKEEIPTANYPKISKLELIKSRLDRRYFSLLTAITLLFLILIYLILR